jgi:HD-GYP domain-containing protein (c-di-GMP phosphodiesterase class II)
MASPSSKVIPSSSKQDIAVPIFEFTADPFVQPISVAININKDSQVIPTVAPVVQSTTTTSAHVGEFDGTIPSVEDLQSAMPAKKTMARKQTSASSVSMSGIPSARDHAHSVTSAVPNVSQAPTSSITSDPNKSGADLPSTQTPSIISKVAGITQTASAEPKSDPRAERLAAKAAKAKTEGTEPNTDENSEQRDKNRGEGLKPHKLDLLMESREFMEQLEERAYIQFSEEEYTFAISDIMTAFSRVTNSFQLYDPRNDAVRDALADLYARIMGLIKSTKSLTLKVEPWAFLYNDSTVYYNDDRENSLAYKLFRDGIRGITIHEGFDWRELAQLLKILGVRYNGVHLFEDDIVTMFWKANFQYVDTIAIEGFELKTQEKKDHRPIEELINRLVEEKKELGFGKTRSKKNFDGTFSMQTEALLQQASIEEKTLELLERLSPTVANYHSLLAQDLEIIQRENNLDHLPSLVHQLLGYIEQAAHIYQFVVKDEYLYYLLDEYRNFLMSEGKHNALLSLLKLVEQWTKKEQIPGGELLTSVAKQLLESSIESQAIRKLLSGINLEEHKGKLPDSTYLILKWADRDPSPALFELLMTQKSKRLRATIREALININEHRVEPFSEKLTDAPNDFCIELLHCLRDINTTPALQSIAGHISHPDPEVQDFIMGMAEDLFQGQQQLGAVRTVVQRLIESNDEDDRNRAYTLIERSKDPRWVVLLHKQLEGDRDYEMEELEFIARLAARVSPDTTLAIVAQMAEPPGRFSFERSSRKKRRIAALAALTQIGDEGAESAIKKLLDNSQGDLRNRCIDAMRELRRQKRADYTSQTDIAEQRLRLAAAKRERTLSVGKPSEIAEESETIEQANVSNTQLVAGQQEVDVQKLQQQMIQALQRIDFQSENAFGFQVREYGNQFVLLLHMLTKTAHLYDASNKIFNRPIQEITELLEKLLDLLTDVTLIGVGEQFYINDVRIRMQGENMQKISQELFDEFNRYGIGGFTFGLPLADEEWRSFFQVLAGHSGEGRARNWLELRQQLKEAGIERQIEVVGSLEFRIGGEDLSGSRNLMQVYAQAYDVSEETWYTANRKQAPNPLPVRRVINDLIDVLQEQSQHSLEVLGIEDPENPFLTHAINTAMMSVLLGMDLDIHRSNLADLGVAAFLHDLGHAVIAESDIDTGENWRALNHKQAGISLLLRHRGFHEAHIKRLLTIVEHHTDAAVNPNTPRPSLYSRIIRVADFYDTMTSALIGSTPISPDRAIELLNSGQSKLFDPTITQKFINRMGRFPIGTVLQLSDNSIAVSLGSDGSMREFTLPSVLIIQDAQGNPAQGPQIELANTRQVQISHPHPHYQQFQPKMHLARFLHRRIELEDLLRKRLGKYIQEH